MCRQWRDAIYRIFCRDVIFYVYSRDVRSKHLSENYRLATNYANKAAIFACTVSAVSGVTYFFPRFAKKIVIILEKVQIVTGTLSSVAAFILLTNAQNVLTH